MLEYFDGMSAEELLDLLVPLQVMAVPSEQYCTDRSAEYEWQMTRSGGGSIFKQCFLHGSPELAMEWRDRANVFHSESPGGVMGLRPHHGWSFIRIPGKSRHRPPRTVKLPLVNLKSNGSLDK